MDSRIAKTSSIKRVIALLLSSIPASERRDVSYSALREAASKQETLIPVFSVLPSDLSWSSSKQWLNGINALLLGLASANADESVGQIAARAQSIVTGIPYAGDPASPNSDPIVAITIMRAAIANPELAKEVASEPLLLDLMARMYVRETKALPPLAGKFDWGNLFRKTGRAAADALLQDPKTTPPSTSSATELVASPGTPIPSVIEEAINKAGGPPITPAPPPSSPDASQVLMKEAESLKTTVANAVEAVRNLAKEQAKASQAADSASLEAAKASWAVAIMDAPDSVANLLRSTSPDTKTPRAFLDSMWELVSAAKGSGDVTTLQALMASMRSAVSKGKISESFALTGDPQDEPFKQEWPVLPTLAEIAAEQTREGGNHENT